MEIQNDLVTVVVTTGVSMTAAAVTYLGKTLYELTRRDRAREQRERNTQQHEHRTPIDAAVILQTLTHHAEREERALNGLLDLHHSEALLLTKIELRIEEQNGVLRGLVDAIDAHGRDLAALRMRVNTGS